MKDQNSLQFCIAKCDFWFVWHFFCEIWRKLMSHDPALLAKTEMLLLFPNMTPWPITNSPAYCEPFQNSLTWIFYNLFTFISPLSHLFWIVAAVKNKICSYLQNTFTLVKKIGKSFLSTRDAPIPFFKDRVRVPIFLSWYSPIPIPVFWDVAVIQVMTQWD